MVRTGLQRRENNNDENVLLQIRSAWLEKEKGGFTLAVHKVIQRITILIMSRMAGVGFKRLELKVQRVMFDLWKAVEWTVWTRSALLRQWQRVMYSEVT